MDIRSYQPADQDQVITLWEACDLLRPWNDPVKDIQRKLARDAELFFVGIHNDKVIASVMAGYEGHRGWVNYLAVSPEFQRGGYGRQIMQHAESILKSLGCPKINLQIRETNIQAMNFYQALGYLDDKVIGLGKRLEVDD
jgi:ribosomal protein S18 acetylase RimI-like enzyme